MLAKVQDMLRRYDDVKLAVEGETPLRLQAEGKIKKLSEDQIAIDQEQVAREMKEEETRKAAEQARTEEQELLQQEAKAREAELQLREQLRIEALAVAANKKREEREKERAEQERQRLAEEEDRERLNASIQHGKEGLGNAITMLQDSTGSEALFHRSLGKLLAVVSNICSSPENAAFRHIPKDNANFHTDLGQYTGGHQCILALGFRELQQGDSTQPRAVFVLEEPDLSEDFDAWSNWFDELKDMKSLIESKF
ncbi:hypothetical protein BBO99_00005429 [Phytophthora kernoviae]|uniref:PUB domain-containing protein n=2 Tax=Phytophthora kernoviae TaxID=325452 RepID=A0A3R7K5G2_9STRA|nr:hypothetical protein G195_006136 [Phytophthora kernoviae 00238/432]KAG2510424.1 hypothetical protein JM16_008543 [Phytophthora kernoviae]KAG2525329.1 hypothetical protein JM18_004945 [Phytophthora kernoviae]RLN20871.1 hypothetical protein BBI17_005522 [Phytophthora kernoviae]RLN79223.1 hypothetical protein BBO99_00005429 [Phytophthora kernoviae]